MTTQKICLINPKFLMSLGHTFCLYRFKSASFIQTNEIINNLNIEAYHVIGPFDYFIKYFEDSNCSFHHLLHKNGITTNNIECYKVTDVIRYAFDSNLSVVPLAGKSTESFRALNKVQENYEDIHEKELEDLVSSKFIIEPPIETDSYCDKSLIKVFITIRFQGVKNDTEKNKYNSLILEDIIPKYNDTISGYYIATIEDGYRYQYILECENINIWLMLDDIVDEIHQQFGVGTLTESFICSKPLFSNIIYKLPDELTKTKTNTDLKKYLNQNLEKSYDNIESIIFEHAPKYSHKLMNLDRAQILDCISFYELISKDYERIIELSVKIKSEFELETKEALAKILASIQIFKSNPLTDGVFTLGKWIEYLARQTLSDTIFSSPVEIKTIQKLLDIQSIKKTMFPHKLNAFETEQKISKWDDHYPTDKILGGKVDLWKSIRDIRNAGAHKTPAEYYKAKHAASNSFILLRTILERRLKLPEERQNICEET